MITRKKEENKEENYDEMEVDIISKSEGDIIVELKMKLKQAEDSREEMRTKYFEIEKKYTEDTEKLKTEIKDLEEAIKLQTIGTETEKVETYADILCK